MKKYISKIRSLFLILLFAPALAWASSVPVTQETTVHEGQERACLSVVLDTDARDLGKAWSKYLRKNHDLKLSGRGFMSAEEVNFEAVSNRTLDLYTRIDESGDMVEMEVFGRYGYDVYLNPQVTPQDFAAMRMVMESFLKEYRATLLEDQIEEQIDRIEDLRDDKEDVQDRMSDNQSEILDKKEEIASLESEINELEQQGKDLDQLSRMRSEELVHEEQKLRILKENLSNINNDK